jgi:penicillin-binding protein 1A
MISVAAKRRIRKFLLWMEILFILVVGAGMGAVLAAFYQMNKLLPPDAALDNYRPPVGTKIYSSDGELLARLATENREPVPLERIPKNMQNAIVAIEDSRFYEHSGLDLKGIARAMWANISGHEMAQGASTLTQQLARNMFLNSKKKISRKIKELLLAIQIERNWTKRQILAAYLNQVYFGASAYGVQAASQAYFKKDVKDLRLEECALLAALPQRPSDLSPYAAYGSKEGFEKSKARRDTVLDRMAELHYITPDQARIAKARPIKVAKTRPPAVGYFHAKHFCQYVMDQLRNKLGYEQDFLDKAGLTVVTTLDWKMQQAAEKAAREGVSKYRGWGRVSEGALVCVDPHNGYIRAMVGSVNDPWEKHQFNCATQARRQPGSSFKIFVYTAGFEAGRDPYSTVNANAYIPLPDGTVYSPHNHGGTTGRLSLVNAFALSVNGAAVNICNDVGPKTVVSLARKFGLTGNLQAYPSIALGVCDVSPLEMASAYGVFAVGGKRAEPETIIQIRSQDGEILDSPTPKITDLGLHADTLDDINILTRAVVTSGTGRGAGSVPDAHGKTGTTEENTDAWFVGYTPNGLATAVWAGNRDNKPMSPRLFGGTICAPIWAQFMQKAVELNPAKKKRPAEERLIAKAPEAPRHKPAERTAAAPLTADENERNRMRVTICTVSGLRATAYCPTTRVEEFMIGEQPLARCPIHTSKQSAAKAAANSDTPPAAVSTGDAGTR